MSEQTESHLLPRIIVGVVIIGASVWLHSIGWMLWQGEKISIFERILASGIILVILATLIYVIIQRIEMRKTEKFRREKW
jgi:ABC-type proline/glycine betaine transport system permease subunit